MLERGGGTPVHSAGGWAVVVRACVHRESARDGHVVEIGGGNGNGAYVRGTSRPVVVNLLLLREDGKV